MIPFTPPVERSEAAVCTNVSGSAAAASKIHKATLKTSHLAEAILGLISVGYYLVEFSS